MKYINSKLLFFNFLKDLFIWDRATEREGRGRVRGEGEAGSLLSRDPDMGPDPRTLRAIMSRKEDRCLTDWATHAPHSKFLEVNFVVAKFRIQSTSDYSLLRQKRGRRESATLFICFNSAFKWIISRSEKEDHVYRNLDNFFSRKTIEISWIFLLFTRRYYLSPNSVHTAGFLFSPGN